MTRGTSKRLSWQGSHNRYKKSSAIYKEAYEKIFKKKKRKDDYPKKKGEN
jgi:hypothetical protein